ncbi:MAG: hypothetical protein AABW99_04620 [archaeon]
MEPRNRKRLGIGIAALIIIVTAIFILGNNPLGTPGQNTNIDCAEGNCTGANPQGGIQETGADANAGNGAGEIIENPRDSITGANDGSSPGNGSNSGANSGTHIDPAQASDECPFECCGDEGGYAEKICPLDKVCKSNKCVDQEAS